MFRALGKVRRRSQDITETVLRPWESGRVKVAVARDPLLAAFPSVQGPPGVRGQRKNAPQNPIIVITAITKSTMSYHVYLNLTADSCTLSDATYDTQIVSSGNSDSTTQPNNTGSIFLNSKSVTLCSDNDVLPSKYVLFKVDGDTNISSQYYKSSLIC